MDIWLGSAGRSGRREPFADGALVVCSRKGVHPSEAALLHALPKGRGGSALVVNSTEALAGLALRALNPDLAVHCHFDDAWDLAAARANVKRQRRLAPELGLAPDPPEGPWDFVVLPFGMAGVAELVHERLAFALRCLRPGGLLFTSTDNRSDRFLHEAVVGLFGSATSVPGPTRRSGVAYVARRPREPKLRPREFRRTFTVREGEGVLSFVSRPGVFCHGRLDDGTRALLAALDVGEARRILDLGCGVGVLGLIAARRSPASRVTLVDSHARAIECTQANAAALGVESRCQAFVSADPLGDLSPGFDLVVSNPPYYGHYRIAQMFLDTAAKVLVPAGRILLVTKDPDWHLEAARERFANVESRRAGGYAIVTATRRA
ncbi:MAG TPA: methyltransferase [Planctomycetota bacterium]|nr:methyltransferase [Planctomycetota bacterium]HRR82019.1 methyltransferase [Planctomycetota bacterium]HRT95098.1 methyltransferase [Planctomycetota bacterium]